MINAINYLDVYGGKHNKMKKPKKYSLQNQEKIMKLAYDKLKFSLDEVKEKLPKLDLGNTYRLLRELTNEGVLIKEGKFWYAALSHHYKISSFFLSLGDENLRDYIATPFFKLGSIYYLAGLGDYYYNWGEFGHTIKPQYNIKEISASDFDKEFIELSKAVGGITPDELKEYLEINCKDPRLNDSVVNYLKASLFCRENELNELISPDNFDFVKYFIMEDFYPSRNVVIDLFHNFSFKELLKRMFEIGNFYMERKEYFMSLKHKETYLWA